MGDHPPMQRSMGENKIEKEATQEKQERYKMVKPTLKKEKEQHEDNLQHLWLSINIT